MPLLADPLAKALEAVFDRKPGSVPDAAAGWANAYQSYAASAMSSLGSLPVTAPASFGVLLSAFTGGLQAQTSSGAAGLIAQGVMSFWSAMVWVGPTAVGTTASPGNASLAAALGAVFADTSEKTAGEKARKIADAFDGGAKLVMVNDVLLIQPAPPVVAPIS